VGGEGGILKSYALARCGEMGKAQKGELAFVQISDSHMGFDKPANPDVVGTFKAAIEKINALPVEPEFILHTGDIFSHENGLSTSDSWRHVCLGRQARHAKV
jgi:hypothetical protein